jgi:protein-tyrosine-phosphatase
MGVLALGYFLAYIPFAALTRALAQGLVPGVDEEVGGLVLLPAASIGVLLGMGAFLYATGWWRAIGIREVRGRKCRVPSTAMLLAGTAMAVIIGTTILNFTFVGVSILFMLLMMRAGTLVVAPAVDLARGKRIRAYAWTGLGLSLLAIVVALAGVDAYTLTLGAVLSLCAYLAGYAVRFGVMSRDAKSGDMAVDRRYFAGEQATAAVVLLGICAAFATIGAGPEMQALREGFTRFLFEPEALLAIAVGLFYSCLYVFGTLIYLDPREYTWSVPVNRASSVLSATLAAYGLAWLAGAEAPVTTTLIAAGIVLVAIAALSYPQLGPILGGARSPARSRRLVIFVCEGNTGRSPTAAAIFRAEVRSLGHGLSDSIAATSAGVSVRRPGSPMAPAAAAALRGLGVHPHPHGSQPLTRDLCERATTIVCMTDAQREGVLAIAPEAAGKTIRLDPDADLPIPDRDSPEAWRSFAMTVRKRIRDRLGELAPDPRAVPAG